MTDESIYRAAVAHVPCESITSFGNPSRKRFRTRASASHGVSPARHSSSLINVPSWIFSFSDSADLGHHWLTWLNLAHSSDALFESMKDVTFIFRGRVIKTTKNPGDSGWCDVRNWNIHTVFSKNGEAKNLPSPKSVVCPGMSPGVCSNLAP